MRVQNSPQLYELPQGAVLARGWPAPDLGVVQQLEPVSVFETGALAAVQTLRIETRAANPALVVEARTEVRGRDIPDRLVRQFAWTLSTPVVADGNVDNGRLNRLSA